jgi:hypothetical protein
VLPSLLLLLPLLPHLSNQQLLRLVTLQMLWALKQSAKLLLLLLVCWPPHCQLRWCVCCLLLLLLLLLVGCHARGQARASQ